MRTLLLLIPTLAVMVTYGQWTNSSVSVNDLHSIQDNGAIVVAGGTQRIYVSYDNGATWNSRNINYVGTQMTGQVKGMHFFNSTDGLITGPFLLSNDEIILSTNDAGLSDWDMAYTSGVGNWPRDVESMQFINSTVGYTAGSNGKVLKTINSGANWGLIAQVGFEELEDIWFLDQTTGFVAGTNGIWKTTDGGTSWSQVYTDPGVYLRAIHFPTSSVGYAVGEYKTLLKTVDGGTTWQDISNTINLTDDLNDVQFLSATTGYVVSDGGIYRTTSGGSHWGYFPTAKPVNAIHMNTTNNGYACGNDGEIYKTTGSTTGYLPVAAFGIDGVACEDSLITFENYSDPSLSFEWYVDGNLVATTYNYTTTFSTGGMSHDVELIVSDGTNTDAASTNLSLYESLAIPMSGSIQEDSLCYNESTLVELDASQNGVTYWLENQAGTQVSATVTGNFGGSFTFNTGAVGTTQTFQLIGYKEVTGCGTNYDTIYFDAYNMTPAPVTHSLLQNPICSGDSTQVQLPSSANGVSYYLMINGNPRSDTLLGTGGSISLQTDALADTAEVQINAIGLTGCAMSNTDFTIDVHVPLVHFNQDFQMQEVGEPVNFFNTSVQGGYNYEWSFENGSPSTFSGAAPGAVTFSSLGYQNVELIGTSSIGCKDSLQGQVKIVPTLADDSCAFVVLADSARVFRSGVKAFQAYEDGSFISLLETDDESYYMNINNMEDTITYVNPEIDQSYTRYHLTRFSPKGKTKWDVLVEIYEDDDTPSTGGDIDIASIFTDANHNVFVAYQLPTYYADSVRITSSDKSVTLSNGDASGGSGADAVMLSKFDSTGKEVWTTTFSLHYTTQNMGIDQDSQGNTYVSGHFGIAKIDVDGNVVWLEVPVGYCEDLEIYNDTIYMVTGNNFEYRKYDLNGNLLFTSDQITTPGGIAVLKRLIIDEVGNMYFAGYFRDDIVFANQTFSDYYSSGSVHEDIIIAKYTASGQEDWARTFKSDKASYIKGFDYKDGQLYLLAGKLDATVQSEGLPLIANTNYGYYAFTCDSANQFANYELIYDHTSGLGNAGYHFNQLHRVGDRLLLTHPYKSDITIGGSTALNNPATKADNSIILNVDPNCIGLDINDSLSSAYFFADVICGGDTLFLNGSGTNNPTSFAWSANGGTIDDSSGQNTFMTFDTTGLYEISLTVSNALGVGGTFTRNVIVSDAPNYAKDITDTVCFDDNAGGLRIPDAAYTVWWDGDTVMGTSYKPLYPNLSPTGDSTFTFTYYNEYGCGTDSSVKITQLPKPTATLVENPGSAVCEGQMLDLTLVSTTAEQFYWDDYGLYGPNLNEPTLWYNQLYVSLINGNGNCWTDTVYYSQHEEYPNVGPGYVDDFCLGDSIRLTANTNGASLAWGNGDVADTTVFMATSDGSIAVTAYSPNGQCGTTTNLNYYIHTPPVVTYDFPPDTVCGSGVQTLETISTENISSYWEVTRPWNGTVYNGTNNNTNQISFSADGDYTVDVSVHGAWPSPCVIDTSIAVTLLPSPNWTSTPLNFCELNSDNNYLIMDTNVNSTAIWLFDGNYVSNNDSIQLNQTGTYTLQMDSLNCTSSKEYAITIYPYHQANILTPDGVAICSGDFSMTVDLISDTTLSCYWTRNGTYLNNNQSLTVQYNQFGEYVLYVQSPGCPASTDTVTVFASAGGNVNISTPQSSNFCAGDSTLLVSDAVGGEWYLSGVNIATNDSVYANTIGWHVAVDAMNQCVDPDSVYVSVTSPPVPNIVVNGNDTICDGENLTLTASNATGITWLYNGGVVGSSLNTTVTGSGEYGLLHTQGGCVSDTDFVEIEVLPNVIPDLNAPLGTVNCTSDSLLLVTTTSNASWFESGSLLSTNDTLIVNQPGWYSVQTITGSCVGADSVELFFGTTPIALISYQPNDSICSYDSVALESSYGMNNNWILNGSLVGSQTVQYVNQSGTYGLYAEDNGCISDTDWVDIVVFPDNTPTISLNGGDLATTTYVTYQWYQDGSSIAGANDQTYTPQQDADYTVAITDSNNCSFISDVYVVNWMKVDLAGRNVNVYPNPTNGTVFLEFDGLINGEIIVYDGVGNLVTREVIDHQMEQINLHEEERGIYFLRIVADDQSSPLIKVVNL
ncbi:YCF48-related protein [Parvicella tangerina]|uniref:Ycf48-like protein n=1 Tax=Parvicella tangerina TaxID=2829795 RepID=A0A916NSG6_9FLAO|nr:YCF48-related protein [Parvicella tangerina]CAG5083774.1 Ycf48-like protein [Parvicella tangerina]